MKGVIVKDKFKNRNLVIYIPPSYVKYKAKIPVVYVQDKESLFDYNKYNILEKLELMFKNKALKEFLLVGIESKKRIDEYTPWYSKSLVEKGEDFGGKGKEYLSFIVEELKIYIDGKYNTKKDKENTGIIGASLGGLISLYAAYIYPNIFGKIGAISPSLWYEGFIDFMIEQDLQVLNNKIYMDVGSEEGLTKKNIQKFMVKRVQEGCRILLSKGFVQGNLKLTLDNGAVHSKEAFVRRFPYALQWLFSIDTVYDL
ncbi:putative hydrolase of the alpha/beta superfamily [Clostridium pasteurianum DSM 525 = ATCC 6013]|uniref:Esterase n=1 Tax=Clostridium pasteurianum DSM 525 = ATCC 6013 TaxID=1262449 RepID=A0A0H3J6I0_CLOPA|nr:alpha/beta hydrolase-fold protein [Clostridium pasteurianum]AJA48797.1 putative hydrolase of the alpha/beta superfamily [Clostridium pasteurianum DSM 525 = ATCC 6013]AJA52785.1 putative hydrolase of the alpha/beta superfamily [Clostridium pasteurianum DSM 525 = ATCC 6013]AOZ76017.1 esterase [Clostridium pasteurianum DSM 525 = ATCC 6013]AOZ79813.1 esterase [Clostridium pasteurianum]ELP60094.1 esterase [Clostridium pasteurianum DSM 525 = ATCC 6013]